MSDSTLACPFLAPFSPVQLTKLLTKWGEAHHTYLNPVWLNNDGQNIIGFLPKKAFYLQAPAVTNESNNLETLNILTSLQMMTVNHVNLSDFFKSNDRADITRVQLSNSHTVDSFTRALINYQQAQITSSLPSAQPSTSAHIKNTVPNNSSAHAQYHDGFIGYVGYDISALSLAEQGQTSDDLSHEDNQRCVDYLQKNQALAYFGHYPLYLTCTIKQGMYSWQLHYSDSEKESPQGVNSELVIHARDWLQELVKINYPLLQPIQPFHVTAQWSYDDYADAFAQTQEYLLAGDCYQINLTQQWQGYLPQQALLVDYLPKLHAHTNTPFSGFLKLQNYELLSCSPELFLTFIHNEDGNGIETKPIKGTRPRGSNTQEDEALKQELKNSTKDLAENVMIVDLLRNDLGKYAKTGSVAVPQRFAIESFNNVHHMVSTVTATLRDDVHPLKVLFESLPAGSITGTPKKRAVEIINELEAEPRGAYCGTMGYMNFDINGHCSGQWNVLIRTLQSKDNDVSLWAGGGITVSSQAEEEYQECWDKVQNIIDVLASNEGHALSSQPRYRKTISKISD